MNTTTTPLKAPYWLDYLCRERTMCSLCHRDGQQVRIGELIPTNLSHGGLSAHRNRQRAAYRRHVDAAHPGLRVRWAR